jgi:TATA-box binding protein (TBP) (component of TFIID and TFIIIB)
MSSVDDYVARIEETCGAEKDVIIVFKYDKKEEAIAKIRQRAQLKNTIAGIILELTFRDISFRVYTSGKVIFRGIKNKRELYDVLAALLL